MKKRYFLLTLLCVVMMVVAGIVNSANAVEESDDISESSVPMPGIETREAEIDNSLINEDAITSDSDIENTVDQKANVEAEVIGIENSDEEDAINIEAGILIDEDENLDADDLGIDDPTILPDSPILYPLKNMWRGVLSVMTVDPVKKAQLKLRFANEKLIEVKKISEKTNNSEIIEKAIDNYTKELEQAQSKIELIKEKADDNVEVDKLIDKIADNQIKHSVLFDRIEKNLSEETSEKFNSKIEIARNNIETNLSKAVLTIVESDKYGEKLENAIENQNGSNFKYFKHLEVLKRVEANVPEEAKQWIQQAQANVQIKFERDFSDLSKEKQQVFQYYVRDIGGNEVRQFEVINDLENEIIPDTMRTVVEKAKGQNIIRIEKQLQNPAFKEKTQQIIKHLETGNMENIRTISELEDNLSSEVVKQIIEIKTKTMENFKEEIKNTNLQDEKVLMEKIEKFHDIKQFEVFQEMDDIIPEDKKEFWNGVKEKAQEEMQNEFQNARNQEEKVMIMKKLSGDMPDQMEIIQKFVPNPTMATEMIREQSANIERKMENAGNRVMSNTSTSNSPVSNNAGLANPAAVHCENQGGRLRPVIDEKGTHTMCVFVDGSQCEEWSFFRGECRGVGYSNTTSEKPMVEPMIDVSDNTALPENIVETKTGADTDSATERRE